MSSLPVVSLQWELNSARAKRKTPAKTNERARPNRVYSIGLFIDPPFDHTL